MLKTLLEREAVLAHLVRAIEDAPPRADPFPHLVLDGAFPLAFHQRMRRAVPDPAFFEADASRPARRRGDRAPRRFPVTPEECETLPGEAREAWRDVITVLSAPALHRALFAKLAVRPDPDAGTEAFPQISLLRDHGEARAPATAGPDVLATLAVPLDDGDGRSAAGLILYGRRSLVGALFAGRLRRAARLESAANVAWAFAGTDAKGRPARFSLAPGADAASGRTTLVCHFRRRAPDAS